MEDDFDLELYIKEQNNKTFDDKIGDKSRKLSSFIKILIIIAAFITAFELYSYASHLIEVWRDNMINETARLITRQATLAPGPEAADIPAAEPFTVKERKLASAPTPSLKAAIVQLRDKFNNNDIIAYLRIEDTNINFPVVQTINNSYYLTHDLRGQINAAGSAFMDSENQLCPLGPNTVIYAHNMRDGSMFHNIRNYSDEQYFNEHKIISLQTLNEDTLWEIFSFYETDTGFLYNTTTFSDADSFIAFANILREKSKYPSAVTLTGDAQILTLSTCTNRGSDLRYVLHAYRFL